MDIFIDPNDGNPVYMQLMNQIKHLIASNKLQPHQEIPPIRTLAKQLLINPNTVARSYRELENNGWVYKKRGAGTFIAEQSSPLSVKEKQRILTEKITSLLVESKQMNIEHQQLISMIEVVFKQLNPTKS